MPLRFLLFKTHTSWLYPVAFSKNPKLQRLWLQNNKLDSHSVTDKTFARNEDIRILNLSNNRITWLSPQVFQSLGKLTHLYLGKNRLMNVEAGTFKNTKELQYLYLGGNLISNFPKFLLSNCTQLKKLGIENNFFKPDGLKQLFAARTRSTAGHFELDVRFKDWIFL